MNKLSIEQLDAEVKEPDRRPPLRKALDEAKNVVVPAAGAIVAGIAGLAKTKPAVNVEVK